MWQPIYFITFLPFCQVNILWTPVQPIYLPFQNPVPQQTARLLYHTTYLLSSPFLIFGIVLWFLYYFWIVFVIFDSIFAISIIFHTFSCCITPTVHCFTGRWLLGTPAKSLAWLKACFLLESVSYLHLLWTRVSKSETK